MTIERLREVHGATPFRPFTLYLADGRQIYIAHRRLLSFEGGRTALVYYPPTHDHSVIDLLLITELRVGSPRPEAGGNGEGSARMP